MGTINVILQMFRSIFFEILSFYWSIKYFKIFVKFEVRSVSLMNAPNQGRKLNYFLSYLICVCYKLSIKNTKLEQIKWNIKN